MKKILFYLITISMLTSCQGQKLGENKIDLENIDLNFEIDGFYADEIKKHQLYESQKDEITNGKKEEEFGEKLINFWDFKHIRIDTIGYRNNEILNDKHRIIGIQYNMASMSEGDSLAYFNKMYFQEIDMMKSINGKFLGLVAKSQNKSDLDFEKLLNYLVKKYGNPNISKNKGYGNYYNYNWLIDDRLIRINSEYNDKKNLLKLGFILNDNKIEFDTIKKSTIDSRLFIVNKKTKDSIIGRLNSGNWRYLK